MRKLAGLRVTAGLTQTEVASALNITQGAVSIWERGDSKLTVDKIQQLADMYGVTAQEIVEACMSNANNASISRGAILDNDQL